MSHLKDTTSNPCAFFGSRIMGRARELPPASEAPPDYDLRVLSAPALTGAALSAALYILEGPMGNVLVPLMLWRSGITQVWCMHPLSYMKRILEGIMHAEIPTERAGAPAPCQRIIMGPPCKHRGIRACMAVPIADEILPGQGSLPQTALDSAP